MIGSDTIVHKAIRKERKQVDIQLWIKEYTKYITLNSNTHKAISTDERKQCDTALDSRTFSLLLYTTSTQLSNAHKAFSPEERKQGDTGS